jgi:hypothetical protein
MAPSATVGEMIEVLTAFCDHKGVYFKIYDPDYILTP